MPRLEGAHIEAHEVNDRAGWETASSCHRGEPPQSGCLGFYPSPTAPQAFMFIPTILGQRERLRHADPVLPLCHSSVAWASLLTYSYCALQKAAAIASGGQAWENQRGCSELARRMNDGVYEQCSLSGQESRPKGQRMNQGSHQPAYLVGAQGRWGGRHFATSSTRGWGGGRQPLGSVPHSSHPPPQPLSTKSVVIRGWEGEHDFQEHSTNRR